MKGIELLYLLQEMFWSAWVFPPYLSVVLVSSDLPEISPTRKVKILDRVSFFLIAAFALLPPRFPTCFSYI